MRSWALCVLTLLRAAGGQEQAAECCVESAACPGNCSAGFGWEPESGSCERCAAADSLPMHAFPRADGTAARAGGRFLYIDAIYLAMASKRRDLRP